MNSEAPIKVEIGSYLTGNVKPLLYEIYHALNTLLETGESTTIDLRALPLAPGEESLIESTLGVGEITAELDALGKSVLRECRYPGVWLIVHYNVNKEIIGKFIEVTFVPALLKSQREDITDSVERLAIELEKA